MKIILPFLIAALGLSSAFVILNSSLFLPFRQHSIPQGAFIPLEDGQFLLSPSGEWRLTPAEIKREMSEIMVVVGGVDRNEMQMLVLPVAHPSSQLPLVAWSPDDRVWTFDRNDRVDYYEFNGEEWVRHRVPEDNWETMPSAFIELMKHARPGEKK